MSKNHIKSIVLISIFITGLIILMNSIKLGQNDVYKINKLNGGSLDTGTYLVYLEQSITKYRFIGTILSVLSGLGVLINTRNKS